MQRFSFTRFLTAALLLAAVQGCEIINPAEEQPVYVRIDSFAFLPPQDGGYTVGLTEQIESAYATYEGKTLGTFDLPAMIPVLPGGGGVLRVRAGVDESGINDFQVGYPYYAFDTLRISAGDAGQTIAFAAKTRYFDSLNYSFRGDFEPGSSVNFLKVTGDTGLVTTNNPTYLIDGQGSGLITVDEAHPTSEVISSVNFLPTSPQPYLEIDYRCNIPFEIGVYSVAQNFSEYLIGVRANPTGAKLYISLELFTGRYASASGFRIQLKTALPSGQSSGFVAIDNLKVVSFR